MVNGEKCCKTVKREEWMVKRSKALFTIHLSPFTSFHSSPGSGEHGEALRPMA